MPHGGKGAFDRVRGPEVFPVFSGEIIECEQGLAILCQALGGLIVFPLVGCDEGVERALCFWKALAELWPTTRGTLLSSQDRQRPQQTAEEPAAGGQAVITRPQRPCRFDHPDLFALGDGEFGRERQASAL